MSKRKNKNKSKNKNYQYTETNQKKKQKQKNYAVAFLDVLGYSEFLKNATNKDIDLYYSHLEEGIREVKYQDKFTSPFTPRKDFIQKSGLIIRLFSDNILLAVKQTGNCIKDMENYQNLLFLILCIQNFFLTKYNILIRGGVTIGKFAASEDIVFGKALVKASELEKEAKSPRVILDKKDILRFYDLSKKHKRLHTNFLVLVVKEDETYFTNAFMSCFVKILDYGFMDISKDCLGITKPYKECEFLMIKFQESLKLIVKNNGTNVDIDVLKKIRWLVKYFNYACYINEDVKYLSLEIDEDLYANNNQLKLLPSKAKDRKVTE